MEAYAERGMEEKYIAQAIGIHPSTLCAKKNEYPELSEAIKRGEANGIAAAAETIMQHIVKKDSLPAAMFYLKCRAGWRENDKPEITLNLPENSVKRTDEELSNRIEEMTEAKDK